MKYFIKKYTPKIGLLSSVCYMWKIGSLSLQTTASLLAYGAVWSYFTSRSLRRITLRDTIVVTGCDSGLGYSLALHCHKHLSARVFAGVHRIDSLGAQELMKSGITVQEVDIRDIHSVNEFVRAVREYLKQENLRLAALINNAGLMVFGEFEWQTETQIRQQVEVNLLGTMKLTKSMLPLLRDHKSRLIVVTSHCANEALPGVAVYGATKAGLAAWTTALRVELKKFDIDVVNFIPGSFVTESNILSRQVTHFQAMDEEMSEETKSVYGEYFTAYRNYLTPLSQENSLKQIKNPRLYEIFDNALMEEPPCASYKCEPWRYTFYHTLLKLSPTTIRDVLVEKFVQMPTWSESKLQCKKKDITK